MTVMRTSLLLATICASVFLHSVEGNKWGLSTTYKANDFYSGFDWYTDADPTHGLVDYQDQASARAANLSYVKNNQFVLAVDTTPTAPETGRRSVRITSKANFSDGVYVLNFSHVPTGCAVWPAFWTVTNNQKLWPVGGEIDIAENANDQYNGTVSSIHTNSSCISPDFSRYQTGSLMNTNCSAYVQGNPGCNVELDGGKPSWGSALNTAGGGVYAMERTFGSTGKGVRVWFFPKGSQPKDLAAGSKSVDTSKWGKPAARFNIANKCHKDFGAHQIIINITLCGDWAAGTYDLVGCNAKYPTCQDQVLNHGSSFSEAYWAIRSLRVYSKGGGTANAARSPNRN